MSIGDPRRHRSREAEPPLSVTPVQDCIKKIALPKPLFSCNFRSSCHRMAQNGTLLGRGGYVKCHKFAMREETGAQGTEAQGHKDAEGLATNNWQLATCTSPCPRVSCFPPPALPGSQRPPPTSSPPTTLARPSPSSTPFATPRKNSKSSNAKPNAAERSIPSAIRRNDLSPNGTEGRKPAGRDPVRFVLTAREAEDQRTVLDQRASIIGATAGDVRRFAVALVPVGTQGR